MPELIQPPLLYGYWRSSSAYRVRIALNLKKIEYRQQAINLAPGVSEQLTDAYRRVNPLGLVPALVHQGNTIVQSAAICEYLEETFPNTPLLPQDPAGRARVRALMQSIASEVQPLNNLAVQSYLKQDLTLADDDLQRWYEHWVARSFAALETWFRSPETGLFCHGDSPTLADCFLVPQVYNAERFHCVLSTYPNLLGIVNRCRELQAFDLAAPEKQPDAKR